MKISKLLTTGILTICLLTNSSITPDISHIISKPNKTLNPAQQVQQAA